MGRKIKPRHLKRDRISISLNLDVLRHLDLIASKGGTRSRYIEGLITKAMLKGQATLSGFIYKCKTCSFEGMSKTDSLKWCRICQDQTLYISRNLDVMPLGEEE